MVNNARKLKLICLIVGFVLIMASCSSINSVLGGLSSSDDAAGATGSLASSSSSKSSSSSGKGKEGQGMASDSYEFNSGIRLEIANTTPFVANLVRMVYEDGNYRNLDRSFSRISPNASKTGQGTTFTVNSKLVSVLITVNFTGSKDEGPFTFPVKMAYTTRSFNRYILTGTNSSDIKLVYDRSWEENLKMPQQSSSNTPYISIRNQIDKNKTIREVYISKTSAWGSNLLAGGTIAFSTEKNINLPDLDEKANYNIRVVDSAGVAHIKRNIYLSRGLGVTFTPNEAHQ